MYAYVKFKVDGEHSIVPNTYIKDYEKNKEFSNTQTYHVFWSPDSEDTPDRVLKKQGKIICEPEKKKSSVPLAGYYEANVLLCAGTEEELKLKVESREQRRIIKERNPKDNNVKKLNNVQQKEKKNKQDILHSANCIQQSLFESSSEEEKENDRATFWRKKYFRMKAKYEEVDILNKKLTKANLEIQNRLLNFIDKSTIAAKQSTQNKQHNTPSLHTVNTKLSETRTDSKDKFTLYNAEVTPVDVNIEINHEPMSQNIISFLETDPSQFIIPTVTDLPNITQHCSPSTDNTTLRPTDIARNITFDHLIPTSSTSSPHLASLIVEETPIQDCSLYQKAVLGVKHGKAGDSLFAKNLAVSLFGSDLLSKSSVTGQRCMAKQNSEAKPPLCPEKMSFLVDAFKKRARDQGATEEDVFHRAKRINVYVSEKIATLNRTK